MFEIYIIQSIKTRRYYIGHSNNIYSRLEKHNQGRIRSTKSYRPWKLVYREKCKIRQDAYRREQQIKSYKSGEAFQKLISEGWLSGLKRRS